MTGGRPADRRTIMKEKKDSFFRRIILRYLLSFLLVLLLPLGVFFLFSNHYFISSYQERIAEYYQAELNGLNREIVSDIRGMQNVAGQFTISNAFRQNKMETDAPDYTNIINALKSIVLPQNFFETISFYSTRFPDTVFTNTGTFNILYYKQYLDADGVSHALPEYLEGIRSGTWVTPERQHNTIAAKGSQYDYIMPVPYTPGDYVIFSISRRKLDELSRIGDFVIFSQNGDILYNSFPVPDSLPASLPLLSEPTMALDDGSVLFFSRSEEMGLILALLLPRDVLYASAKDMQWIVLLVFLGIAITGGLLVLCMTALNYKPVRIFWENTQTYVEGVRQELDQMKDVGGKLEQMHDRFNSLQERARRERAMMQLVYGRISEEASLRHELSLLGLNGSAGGWRTALLHGSGNVPAVMLRVLTEYPGGQHPFAAMEYLPESCWLLLIEDAGDPDALRPFLQGLLDHIFRKTGQNLRLAVGKRYEDPALLPRSFLQAQGILDRMPEDAGIWICEETSSGTAGYPYPVLDLQVLHNAILQLDEKKFSAVSNMLLEIVRHPDLPRFSVCAISCDIINCCLTGLLKIRVHPEEIIRLQQDILYNTEPERYPELAGQLVSRTLGCMLELREEGGNAEDLITQVLSFIDQNCDNENLNVSYVAQAFSLSASGLSHKFKDRMGKNISDYIMEKRLEWAKQLLRDTRLSIGEIARQVGYSNAPGFARIFKLRVGMTPGEYRGIYQ